MDCSERRLARVGRAWLLGLLAMACLFPACGHRPLPLAYVSGRVTVDGRPVEQGRITFLPVDGRRPATAPLGSDGRYALGTFNARDGAAVGDHAVVIDARAADGPRPTSLADELARPTAGTGVVTWIVPEPYAAAGTTPLRTTVTAGRNVLDFDVPISEPPENPASTGPR